MDKAEVANNKFPALLDDKLSSKIKLIGKFRMQNIVWKTDSVDNRLTFRSPAKKNS